MSSADRDDFTAAGHILEHGSLEPCTVYFRDGRAEIDIGVQDKADMDAVFIRDMVNGHTHCGDYGLKVPPGMSLEELVAPPNGLKHRYLSGLDEDGLRENISGFDRASAGYGAASYIDFREGGAPGCRMLRECSDDAVILGRPLSPEYDPGEVDEILSIADGIGIPSISDMDLGYIEALADDVRKARKILAIHVSERVREDMDIVLSLDPAFVVHMCEATDDDMAKCAEAEVPIVICPTSNAYFGKETPVVRMLDNGADIALGTDNGMLCEPDLVSEAGVLAGIIARQGGDPEDAWKGLSNFTGKLLYRIKRMRSGTPESYLTVIPQDGVKEHQGRSGSFRVRLKRGVIDMAFSKILVPTDGSEYTKPAIRQAIELAKLSGGEVTALYVLDQTVLTNMPMDTAVMNVYKTLEKEGQEAVDFVNQLADENGVKAEVMIKEGTPVKIILEESPNYDIIVMGTLGRTGMSKLLMGSVAERVVRAASCPVMVVRAPEASE